MPPRTKSCAICRRKRIRCDATLPKCLMCQRTGKDCPGVDGGAIIVDMTSTTATKVQRKQREKDPNALSMPTFPDQLEWQVRNQVSQGAVINQAFYANFLTYFTSDGEGKDIQNKMTWLHRLPELSSDGTNLALNLALRATASAYCGAETGNVAVIRDACRLYGEALQAHARVLRTSQLGRNKDKEVTVHMVSTSVMLSLFEAMQATTAEAYCEHVNGAVRMIEVTGPGQCMEGVMCQLFFHIRTQMAFVYLTTRKPQPIQLRKILVENLGYKKLPMFQQLMTYIAALAELYVTLDSSDPSPDSRTKPQAMDLDVYQRVKSEVEELWSTYLTEASFHQESLFFPGDGPLAYPNAFAALCVAYFSAARVLLQVLAPRFSSSYFDFVDHFAIIMNCARFLRTKKIGCAYMRMATPLYLVSVQSPSTEQRDEAVAIFEDWRRGSMAGISALALETIKQRQAEASGKRVEFIRPNPLQDMQLPMTFVGNDIGIPGLEQQISAQPVGVHEAEKWIVTTC